MPNPRLDLTSLRVFAAVAQLRNISKAARRENMAVSAVSKRISDLEEILGAKLFDRLHRGVEPTSAGSTLLHHATAIMHSLDQLESDLAEYATGIKGHVRMMVNESSLVEELPEDLSAFVQNHPDIKIDLREGNSAAIVQAVADGLVELGVFTAGVQLPRGLCVHPYRTDRLALIVPMDHPLARRSKTRLADVLDYDFVGLDVGSAWNDLLSKVTAQLDRPLRLRFRVDSFDAVCRMVRARLGISLVPPAVLGAFTSAAGLIAVPLDETWTERQLMICVRDRGALPASARLMVEHLTGETSGHTQRRNRWLRATRRE